MFTKPQTPLVFAYYFLATSTYGFSQANYAQDITDAQALGIDGFVVAAGAWSAQPTNYPVWAAALFAAALAASNNSDGTKFKLFFSAEVGGGAGGITVGDVQTMLGATFVGTAPASGTGPSNTNYYWLAGKPMLTTSHGKLGADDSTGDSAAGLAFWNSVFTGFSASFYPAFQTARPTGGQVNTNNPTYAQISADWTTNYSWWPARVNGLAYFTTDGLAVNSDGSTGDLITSEEAYAAFMATNSRLYVAGVQSYYASTNTGGTFLLADERYGAEGIAAQWASIINTQKPTIVILYTWNDLSETAITPSLVANQFNYSQYLRHPHIGLSQINAYFIDWFKNNSQPAVTNDKLFYFYRTIPAAVTAGSQSPTTLFFNLIDYIFVTTILTAPATVRVINNGVTTDTAVASGLVHTRVAFVAGAVEIKLIRSGSTLIDLTGESVSASTAYYDHNPTTGYGVYP